MVFYGNYLLYVVSCGSKWLTKDAIDGFLKNTTRAGFLC